MPKPRERFSLGQLLEEFRAVEIEDDLVVVDDPEAIRLLAAWRKSTPVWRKPLARMPQEPVALWAWLWDGVYYDREELAVVSKLNEQTASQLLRVCAHARLAYPDGTISKHAAKLIKTQTQQRYPGKKTGRPFGAKDTVKRTYKKATDE